MVYVTHNGCHRTEPAGHRSAGSFIHGKHLFWSIARGEGASRSVTSRRICKSNRHANASCAVHQTALSLLRGAFFMHRMRARMPRIAFSPLRGAIFLHRMCACMPIIVLPLRRGAFFHVSDAGVYALKCALAAARCIFLCIGCVCLWSELRSRCCAVHFFICRMRVFMA